MGNLIKAHIYQIRKSRLPFIVFFFVLVLEFLAVFFQFLNGDSISGSGFVAENAEFIPSFSLIFVIVFVGVVCGGDFMDKTANYELMSGHRRRDVYFSRVIICLVGGGIGVAALLMTPVLLVSLIGGWGTEMDSAGLLLRYLLSLLPVLRIICEFVFLTYVVKNAYIIMASAYFVFVLYTGLPDFFPKAKTALLGLTNYISLYRFRAWEVYTVAEFKQYTVYNSAVPAELVWTTIAASLGFGALFLILGYLFFKKDDIH